MKFWVTSILALLFGGLSLPLYFAGYILLAAISYFVGLVFAFQPEAA